MVDTARLSQEVVEVIETGSAIARLSQEIVEVIETGSATARLAQLVVEIIETGVGDNDIPIGGSSITYTGQSLFLPIITNIPIGNSSISYSGQSLILQTLAVIPIGNASITWTGQNLTLSTSNNISIGNGNITYSGRPFTVAQYPVVKDFEPAKLVPFPSPGEVHFPCGHWHEGQSDNPVWNFVPQEELPIPYHKHPVRPEICGHWHKQGSTLVPVPILFGAGSNASGQLGLPYGEYYPTLITVTETDVALKNVISAGTSSYISAIVLPTKKLYVTGSNTSGNFGLGDVIDRSLFTYTLGSVEKVAVAGLSMLVVKTDGTLWAIGNNSYGQLGLGDYTPHTVWTQVGVDTNWQDVVISAGSGTTIALKTDGTLWSWGRNDKGQLGQGDTTQRNTPTQVGVATDWAKIACGYKQSFAIKTDYKLYGCGWNLYGQLGVGDTTDRNVFTQEDSASDWYMVDSGYAHTIGIKRIGSSNGSLWGTGRNNYNQLGFTSGSLSSFTQIGTDEDWNYITTSNYSSYARKLSLYVYSTGNNSYGQLGQGDLVTRAEFTLITTAQFEFLIAREYSFIGGASTGYTYAAGDNSVGQLGVDYRLTSIFVNVDEDITWSDVKCGSYHTVLLKDNNSIWGCGWNANGQLGIPLDVGSYSDFLAIPRKLHPDPVWLKIAGGRAHSIALKQDGTLWGTGYNYHGQLGLGDNIDRATWEQIGSSTDWVDIAVASSGWHTVARKADGTLWACGRNTHGQLGQGDTTDRNVFTQIGVATDWLVIAGGEEHTLAINTSGELWVCGYNSYGQLGLGDTTDRLSLTQVGVATDWEKCFGGEYYSYAIKTDQTGYSTGGNYDGQLGQGDLVQRTSFTIIPGGYSWVTFALGCSGSHVLGIQDDETLWTVGNNDFGQLGLDLYVDYQTSFQKVIKDNITDGVSTWKAVGAGIEHSVAIKTLTYTSVPDVYSHNPVWSFTKSGDV